MALIGVRIRRFLKTTTRDLRRSTYNVGNWSTLLSSLPQYPLDCVHVTEDATHSSSLSAVAGANTIIKNLPGKTFEPTVFAHDSHGRIRYLDTLSQKAVRNLQLSMFGADALKIDQIPKLDTKLPPCAPKCPLMARCPPRCKSGTTRHADRFCFQR